MSRCRKRLSPGCVPPMQGEHGFLDLLRCLCVGCDRPARRRSRDHALALCGYVASAFPDIQVDDASLYRSHDRLYTSAGSAAGMDLLIEIVRQDFGSAAADMIARRLVIPAHRKGGQAQFLERPVRQRDGTEVAPLLDKIRQNLAGRWTVASMARECRMSNRTFLRRFAEATGDAQVNGWRTTRRNG